MHQLAPWGEVGNILNAVQTVLKNPSYFEILKQVVNINFAVNIGRIAV
jgi:hypothetical protein